MAAGETPRRWHLFVPKLAGASLNDRLIACAGAGLGVLAAALAGLGIQDFLPALPFLIAPIGASAVLVFVVPSSPLAQPWPVVDGNVISAIVGVAVLHNVPNTAAAIAIAVGGAIFIMSLLRCLHPPGGAAAITTILGAQAVIDAGYIFPISIVAANSLALVAFGFLFHKFTGHSYPHRVAPAQAMPMGLLRADIDQAVKEAHETFDIDLADLEAILLKAERIAEQRRATR
nr:HPP family protein [uncultured Sphingorhabdus sp.]